MSRSGRRSRIFAYGVIGSFPHGQPLALLPGGNRIVTKDSAKTARSAASRV